MDLVRSCYTARWYPYPARPELYWDVRWYEVPRNRPWLPFPTIWRSSNWDELTDVLSPGERADTARWCPPGPPLAEPLALPGVCGPAALWAGELPENPADLVALVIDPLSGVPFCCGPQLPRLRGGHVGGGDLLAASTPPPSVIRLRGGHVGGGQLGALAHVDVTLPGGHVGGGRIVQVVDEGIAGGHVGGGDLRMAVRLLRDPYFGAQPGRWYEGCGVPLPSYTGWLVPGGDASIVTDPNLPAPGVISAVPWIVYDTVTIQAAIIRSGDASGGEGIRLRAAIYENRADGCAYPGALFFDGGEFELSGNSNNNLVSFGGLTLPGNRLYWFVMWPEGGLQLRCLCHPGAAGARPYAAVEFVAPGAIIPMAGWLLGGGYFPPDEVPFPDPWPPGGTPIDVDGVDEITTGFIGLPAVWLLVKNLGGGPPEPIDVVLPGGHVGGGDLVADVRTPQILPGGHVGGGDLEAAVVVSYDLAGGHVGGGDLEAELAGPRELAGGHVGGGDLEAAVVVSYDLAGGHVGGGDLEES